MSDNLFFSKSKYCDFCKCQKKSWLMRYKPEVAQKSNISEARINNGIEIGNLAKGLFGEYVDVSSYENDRIDLKAMLLKTQEEVAKETNAICEAAFSYNGLYCAVDILKKDADGWTIYEVKSSTKEKPIYSIDVAYQKYVLEKCGLKINGTYLVCVNSEYIYDGTLDIKKYFRIIDLAPNMEVHYEEIEKNLEEAAKVLLSEAEPVVELGKQCEKAYECPFFEYCTRDLPKPSVFDLYGMQFRTALKFHKEKLDSFEDLLASNKLDKDMQLRQIEYTLEDKGTYIDSENIKEFLKTLSYPLYFLDFESVQPVIPVYENSKPYAQIPFQYSLHYIEEEGGPLMHKEFLGESDKDPRRAIAESLCRDIPLNVCTTAYNKTFECTRLKELAEQFPDLAEHLLNISDHIVDLLDPFQGGFYYNKKMGNSFSIKSVLPSIFPDDPELDYHNLEGVHNGGEAMDIFPRIKDMSPEDQKVARHNLLEYCKLDTYAMVKVWEELVRASKE